MVLKGGEEMPEVFTDPLVKRSGTWVLSTSAVFSKHFGPYGWGEVVPNGFGVAYMTGFDGAFRFRVSYSSDMLTVCADYLQYTVTSRTEMPNGQFVKEIERAADDMYKLFEGTSPRSKL